jgi:hypothetical protein
MKSLLAVVIFLTSSVFAAEPRYRTIKASPDNDASVRVNGVLQRIIFEPAAVRVSVRLETGTHRSLKSDR